MNDIFDVSLTAAPYSAPICVHIVLSSGSEDNCDPVVDLCG